MLRDNTLPPSRLLPLQMKKKMSQVFHYMVPRRFVRPPSPPGDSISFACMVLVLGGKRESMPKTGERKRRGLPIRLLQLVLFVMAFFVVVAFSPANSITSCWVELPPAIGGQNY